MTVDDHGSGHDAPDPLLRDVPAEVEPPAELRRALLKRLGEEGLVARARLGAPLRWVLAAAALAAVFVAGRASVGAPGAVEAGAGGGVVAGEGTVLEAPADSYALLLYEDDRFDPGALAGDELVALYGDWAARVGQEGRLVLAEKLDDGGTAMFGGTATDRPAEGGDPLGALTGLFIVTAPSAEAALDLARSMPHHRFGGTVLVRAIDPT